MDPTPRICMHDEAQNVGSKVKKASARCIIRHGRCATVSMWHSFGHIVLAIPGSILSNFGAQGGPRVPKCEDKSVDLQKSEKNQIQRRFLQPKCVCKTATPCVYFEP